MSRSTSLPTEQPLAPSRVATQTKSRAWIKQVAQAVVAAALAIGSYYLISHYLVQSVQVVGSSMVPTLHNSEHYLLNRWVYHFKSPKRSDIVVLRDKAAGCYSVKRVIAVPGDSIYLKDGCVFLNGRRLDEPYLAPDTATFATKDGLSVCARDQYFVLGDNRMNSADSRMYGMVMRENIIGMLVQ